MHLAEARMGKKGYVFRSSTTSTIHKGKSQTLHAIRKMERYDYSVSQEDLTECVNIRNLCQKGRINKNVLLFPECYNAENH